MAGLNRVSFIGNLTRDLELKYLPSGKAIIDFCLAINEKRKGKTETLFIECTAFDKCAESCSEYLGKGSQVMVEGRLVKEEWIKNGEKKSKMKVMCNGVHFLDRKERAGNDQAATDEIGW